MAAITTTLADGLICGDHLLLRLFVRRHSLTFSTRLRGFRARVRFHHGDEPRSGEGKLRPNTKAIYVEAMSNPRCK